MKIMSLTAALILIIFRLLLILRLNSFKEIILFFTIQKKKKEIQRRGWIIGWSVVNIVMQVINLMYQTGVIFQSFDKNLIFGIELKPPYRNVFLMIYSTLNFFLFIMPINTFSIFYVNVCYDLKRIIQAYSNEIHKDRTFDYVKLLESYNNIALMVEKSDNELCVFIFCSTVFNSIYMYLFISSFLHPYQILGTYHLIYHLVFFADTFLSFFAMNISASLVNEASALIAIRARSLSAKNLSSALALQRYHLCVDKEINLTIWKIVPIKRNFTLGIIGVIFTYALLLDSLNHQ